MSSLYSNSHISGAIRPHYIIIGSTGSQGCEHHFSPLWLSKIPTPSDTTHQTLQNSQTLQWFLRSLYLLSLHHYWHQEVLVQQRYHDRTSSNHSRSPLPCINEQEEQDGNHTTDQCVSHTQTLQDSLAPVHPHPSSYSSLQDALNPNVQGAYEYIPPSYKHKSPEPIISPTIIPLSSYSSLAGALGPMEFKNVRLTTLNPIHTVLAYEKVSHYSSLTGALGGD